MQMIDGYYYKDIVTDSKGKRFGVTRDNKLHRIADNTKSSILSSPYNSILMRDVSSNFDMVTMSFMEKVKCLSSENYDMLLYILKNRNISDNTLHVSQKELAGLLHTSLRSIKYNLKILKDVNFIKTGTRQIFVCPTFAKGSSTHRKRLLNTYLSKPMDSHHKVIYSKNTYNKVQLKHIAQRIVGSKLSEFNVKLSSNRNVWAKMLKNAINYSDKHYSQYGTINTYIILAVRKSFKDNSKYRKD